MSIRLFFHKNKRARAAIFTLLTAIFLLAIPRFAYSHMLDTYGYGARAIGMGGAFTAVADDYSALYYNIGGLVQIEKSQATVGFMFARPSFDLSLPAASGVSKSQAKALHKLEKSQTDLDDVNGYFVGVAVKPHRLFAMGIGAYLPEGLVVRLEPIDAHVPTFVLHEHRSQRVVTLVGASIRVLPMVSIGGGVRLFLKTKGYFNLPVQMSQETLNLKQGERGAEPFDPNAELRLDFPLTTYPFAGIHFQPFEDLRFGVSYQYYYSLDIDIKVNIDIAVRNYTLQLRDLDKIAPGIFPIRTVIELNVPELGDTPLRVPVELSGLEGELTVNAQIPLQAMLSISDLWKPQSLAFGAAYDPIDALTLSFDAVWFDWSQFPSPDMKIKINDISVNLQTLPATIQGRIKSLSVPVLGTIGPLPPVSINVPGLDVSLTIPVDIQDSTRVKTRDIIVPHFGVEYRLPTVQSFWWTGDLNIALRSGYVYHPTPFVPSKGGANLIDSDTHTATTGLGLIFNDLFTLDFYAQYQYFKPITVHKDTIDPSMPFESYAASGHILGTGFSAGIRW